MHPRTDSEWENIHAEMSIMRIWNRPVLTETDCVIFNIDSSTVAAAIQLHNKTVSYNYDLFVLFSVEKMHQNTSDRLRKHRKTKRTRSQWAIFQIRNDATTAYITWPRSLGVALWFVTAYLKAGVSELWGLNSSSNFRFVPKLSIIFVYYQKSQ